MPTSSSTVILMPVRQLLGPGRLRIRQLPALDTGSTFNLPWMALETGNSNYTEGKSICEDILHSVSSRWEVAGKSGCGWASSTEV